MAKTDVPQITVEERWSGLKKAILNDPATKKNSEALEGYKKVFKTFDQGLTQKAKQVQKDAAKVGKDANDKNLKAYKKSLTELIKVVKPYEKQLTILEKPFVQKYMAKGTFKTLKINMAKIRTDAEAALKQLG